jgi:formate hydrogenlyase regulatory protein HycA
MPVPERIPVKREPHYRTEYAGLWARGQFLGNVISQPDRRAVADGKADWREYSRWFAYLHEFDHGGRYLESTVESPGLGPQARDEAMRLLRGWLAGIPGLAYGDIAIRPRSAPNTSAWTSASSLKTATGRAGPSSTPTASGSANPGAASTTPRQRGPWPRRPLRDTTSRFHRK